MLYGIKKRQAGDSTLNLRCIAEFVDGRDVTIKNEGQDAHPASSSKGKEAQRNIMRVCTHRKFVDDAELNPHDPILHCIVLVTHGQSLVTYTMLVGLLSAAECVAEGMIAVVCQYYTQVDLSSA